MSAPAFESLSAFITPMAAGAHVTAAAFLGDTPVFALGDGAVILGDDARRLTPHEDSILAAASNGKMLATGGADGRVVITTAGGTAQVISETKGAWIDAIALSADGAVAWSVGKQVHVQDVKGAGFSLEAPSTVRGLAFAPKGFQVAIAHYGGVTLWFPRTSAPPKRLEWKGSHIDVSLSPDGRFVVTSMQENALHGWRIVDANHMRMSGYPAKTRSLSWSPDGNWLATSGADAAILWPFSSKDGPIGKAPQELGLRPHRVTAVAYHPKAPVLLQGYEDGCILMVRTNDKNELLARPPAASGPITAMAWNATGTRFAFGSEGGEAGLLALPKI